SVVRGVLRSALASPARPSCGSLRSALVTAAPVPVTGLSAPVSPPAPDPFPTRRSSDLQKLKEKTGYPEDMFELDLDLEADLGIETGKQHASAPQTRTQRGPEVDPDIKLRDHNTLRKIIQHLAARLDVPAGAPAIIHPAG